MFLFLLFAFGLSCGEVAEARVFQYTHNDKDVKWDPKDPGDPGEPLFLTKYIEEGKIAEAHELSEVKGIGGIPSYSGFFTVNKDYNSNMFFWFFPAQNGNKEAPVLLWLQGGPGGSSLFGLFVENGPFYVTKDAQIMKRAVTWNSEYAMLYIDNPVGTGFSFTDNDSGYSTDEIQVASNLFNCLEQFFTVFAEYQKNEFYISGESYAGKYVPATAYHIHLANMEPSTKIKLNLKGILVGDGWTDPVNMVASYAPLMMQYGIVCENEASYIANSMAGVQTNIEHNDYKGALTVRSISCTALIRNTFLSYEIASTPHTA
jgi:vitellogenic carboxypeptidase-like protein